MNNIKDDLTNRKLMLKEKKRDFPSNIIENENGICIYTGYLNTFFLGAVFKICLRTSFQTYWHFLCNDICEALSKGPKRGTVQEIKSHTLFIVLRDHIPDLIFKTCRICLVLNMLMNHSTLPVSMRPST